MLVRCLRSSFDARRFFCSSSVVESSISSTVAAEATRPTNAEVSTQNNTNSNMPASHSQGKLSARLFHLRRSDPKGAAAVMAKWKKDGNVLSKSQIVYAIRLLKHRHDYAKALMICDSMIELKDLNLSPSDYALHIELIFRKRGLQSAEEYFDSIPEEMKNAITWTALLHILVKKGEVVKAEVLMEEMKKNGFLPNPHSYVHMISLYLSKEQLDKAEEMNNEVKKCIPPNIHIYNMWLAALASGKDVECAEKAFAQMKEAKVETNWLTHSILAGMYMKRELLEKAGAALKVWEDVAPPVAPHTAHVYCSLIRMHGSMGNEGEVMRIWDKLKSKRKMSNLEYGNMVSTLLKLNLSEKADEIFKEWESSPKSSNAQNVSLFRSMLLRKCGKNGEIPPSSIPEHTEEEKVESMVESDLELQESKQL